MKRAFTLMELLVVMLIIGILVALSLVGLNAAINDARASRTRSIVNKIDTLISEKWEGYRVRAVRIPQVSRNVHEAFVDGNGNGHWDVGEAFTDSDGDGQYTRGAGWLRLMGLRELQRIELPDRISDLCTAAELLDLQSDDDLDAVADSQNCLMAFTQTPSAVTRSYKRLAERSIEGSTPNAWTTQFQGSECLYLILSTIKDHDKSGLEFFSKDEIGDTDGDGMKEILDGWGRPLEFLRWAPGYTIQNLAVTDQTADTHSPDPFDPLKSDGSDTYAIRPLIYSAGPDASYDVNRGVIVYVNPAFPSPLLPGEIPNDPYYAASPIIGLPTDTDGDGIDGWADNISNHAK